MEFSYEDVRKSVLDSALPEVAFDGWSDDVLARAGAAAGVDADLMHLAFPNGVSDLVEAFSKQGDQLMLAALPDTT